MEGSGRWASNKEVDLMNFSDVFEIVKESYAYGRESGNGLVIEN